MNAKPKTGLNSSVFIQKRCNVNGALDTQMWKLLANGISGNNDPTFHSGS